MKLQPAGARILLCYRLASTLKNFVLRCAQHELLRRGPASPSGRTAGDGRPARPTRPVASRGERSRNVSQYDLALWAVTLLCSSIAQWIKSRSRNGRLGVRLPPRIYTNAGRAGIRIERIPNGAILLLRLSLLHRGLYDDRDVIETLTFIGTAL